MRERLYDRTYLLSMLHNSSSGTEVGLPNRIAAGHLSEKHQDRPSGRPADHTIASGEAPGRSQTCPRQAPPDHTVASGKAPAASIPEVSCSICVQQFRRVQGTGSFDRIAWSRVSQAVLGSRGSGPPVLGPQGLGPAKYGPKPHEFIGFGATQGSKLCKCIGLAWDRFVRQSSQCVFIGGAFVLCGLDQPKCYGCN